MIDNNLIIIASQPRSGSTLLQALLSNNNQVATVSEPWLLLPFLSYKKPQLSDATYSSYLAAQGIEDFKSKIDKNTFDRDLAQFLLNQYDQIRTKGEKYVLDKTPRYYEILDEITDLFPNAKIIVLKRNPLAVLASIITTWGKNDIRKLLEFKRDLLYAPIILNDFANKNRNNPNIITIRYEDIILETDKNIGELYKGLDIPYDDGVLDYGNNSKFKGFMGDPNGVHQNSTPNKESLDLWGKIYNTKYWRDFFIGYTDYLTPEFLYNYGNYNDLNGRKTAIFNYYRTRTEWSFDEYKIPLKKILKDKFLRKFNLVSY
ncbi:MAG: sulfotransferase [Marinilabiliaceae bacterium]|nr:sulfotransferase [Marinilabiliaceae bacterium]